MITVFFKTCHSLKGKSLISLSEDKGTDYSKELPDDRPLSLLEIARTHKLPYVNLYEDDPNSLVKAKKLFSGSGIQLRYICSVTIQGTVASYKVGVALKKSSGYNKFCKLLSESNTKENFTMEEFRKYYDPEYFKLIIPFYGSFLYNNFLDPKKNIEPPPDLKGLDPIFLIQNHDVIYDSFLAEKVKSFCLANSYKTLKSRTVLYYRPYDAEVLLTYKLICNRKFYAGQSLNKPSVDFFSSNRFAYLNYDL